MRDDPAHAAIAEATVRTLIAENPWATIVSPTPNGLVASDEHAGHPTARHAPAV